jgi:hypothetical protein
MLPEIELPALIELTLHGPFISATTHPRASFPSLRKLYIDRSEFQSPRFLAEIAHLAPQLTHLRVPQRSFSAYQLQVALGILEPYSGAMDLSHTALLCRLEKLAIDLEPKTDSWAGNIRAEQLLRKLRQIECKDGRVELIEERAGPESVR